MCEKGGKYFSCIFSNGFTFGMSFLTKGVWLSLWNTQDYNFLGSRLTDRKSYTISNHLKFIESAKYYQQPLSKLAQSTDDFERQRIKSVFRE